MNRKASANAFGYASLICSLSFWVLLALRLIPGFPRIDFSFNYWLAIWTVGLVLAFVAAALDQDDGPGLFSCHWGGSSS